jgi:glycogen phosphorylase
MKALSSFVLYPWGMKAHRSFTVRTQLPEPLTHLQTIATNLRWSWDDRTRRLFRWVDSDRWEASGHDPVAVLAGVPSSRLAELQADPDFMAFLDETHDHLTRYLDSPGWQQLKGTSPLTSVAYFSPEFGISEALPQYSGGLGVLAGDHLKAASGLNIPLTGVGLFYRQGYFRQEFNTEGLQVEHYPVLDPNLMAMVAATYHGTAPGSEQARIEVDLSGTKVVARIWKAMVGRIQLFLLDADIDDNDPDGRAVTDRLYGGGEEHRIRQEILLGIGGVRALQAVGVPLQVFHTNEGHAGFLGLERIRQFVTQKGLSFEEAIEATRAGTLFTTHTPVPAGIDRFPRPLMEKYFARWAEEVGISFDRFMDLGHEPGDGPDAPFNMAVMGLRLAGQANGVSKLHGDVSRAMFANLWPGVPEAEVPIRSVTNGVHARTWTALSIGELFDRYVLPEWPEASRDRWARIHDCPDATLWKVKEDNRARLVTFARDRLRKSLEARGDGDLSWTDRALDPDVLTIGFARRFATYKRANLLLSDPERLRRLLLNPEHPVQFVFAGKAHPADSPGKEIMRTIIQSSLDPAIRHRVVFIENYDIGVARMMYQGSDVWLNNPIRPLEACGTSGEKATLNGCLNLSVSDGWWDELYRPAGSGQPANGWIIPSAEAIQDQRERDRVEANALFDLLEREVVPMFYDRLESPLPRRWIYRIKTSLATLGHDVSASRMGKDHTTGFYEPAAVRAGLVAGADGSLTEAKTLHAWKQRVRSAWDGVSVSEIAFDGPDTSDVGEGRTARAEVTLGSLRPEDVDVQLIHGVVGLGDELEATTVVSMRPESGNTWAAPFTADHAGRYGFTIRVVPQHAALSTWAEVGVQTIA